MHLNLNKKYLNLLIQFLLKKLMFIVNNLRKKSNLNLQINLE